MKTTILLSLLLLSTASVFGCDEITYQSIGQLMVSPQSSEGGHFTMLPFRGEIDTVKISRQEGQMSIFDVAEAYMEHNYGRQSELWFNRVDGEDAIVAETHLRAHDRVELLYLELTNRDWWPMFYQISVGKCQH